MCLFSSSLFALILLFVTSILGNAEKHAWHYVGSTEFPNNYLKTMVAEGLSNDGERFVINSKDQIFLTTIDFDVLISNTNAIPVELRKNFGYNHLGDCQYADGMIYFPVEEPSYSHPAIFVYSINKKSIDFKSYKMQPIQKHMPWIAMDPVNRILYTSEYYNASQLFAYNATTLEYLSTVEINIALDEVQGGAFHDGLLYLGVNAHDTVYAIDLTTGEVNPAISQEKDGEIEEYEYEGLTFLDLSDSGRGVMHNTGK